jgi:hypothetical protein
MGKDEETEIGVKCSVFDIRFSFDVGRSMFDVRRSPLKTIPHGINVTCDRLQNNLALMGFFPQHPASTPPKQEGPHWAVPREF